MTKYKVGDVIQFGDDWMLILDSPGHRNVTFRGTNLFLGRYDPMSGPGVPGMTILFNIFDIKRKVEDNERS